MVGQSFQSALRERLAGSGTAHGHRAAGLNLQGVLALVTEASQVQGVRCAALEERCGHRQQTLLELMLALGNVGITYLGCWFGGGGHHWAAFARWYVAIVRATPSVSAW